MSGGAGEREDWRKTPSGRAGERGSGRKGERELKRMGFSRGKAPLRMTEGGNGILTRESTAQNDGINETHPVTSDTPPLEGNCLKMHSLFDF